MRNILTVAFTQIQVQLAERGTLITLFVVPIIMMIAIGTFSGQGGISTGRIDITHGGDPLAQQFVLLLRQEGAKEVDSVRLFEVCDLSAPSLQSEACALDGLAEAESAAAFATARVDERQSLAAVVLPATFSDDLQAGRKVVIGLKVQSGNPFGAQNVQRYVEAVNARISGAVIAAKSVTELANGDSAFYRAVYRAAEAAWATDPVRVNETTSTVTGGQSASGFGQSVPGIGSMFVLINAAALAQIFVTERKRYTLQRLIMMPMPRSHILIGKLFGQFLLCLGSFSVMLGVGSLLGVQWGNLVALMVLVIVFTLCATALGLAIAAVARSASQAASIGFLIPMVMAPLGGAWWPLEITPQAMQTVARFLSPITWSQEAFGTLIYYGGTLTDILPNLAALLIFTAVFFGFGMWRFRLD